MRILIKDPLGKITVNWYAWVKSPYYWWIVDKRLNPELPDKYFDPTPEFWGEELKENIAILRVPMKQWKGGAH